MKVRSASLQECDETYLLLRSYREHAVDEGTVRDDLEPRVREARRNAWSDDAERMAECCENLP